jgi:hypothetical protein
MSYVPAVRLPHAVLPVVVEPEPKVTLPEVEALSGAVLQVVVQPSLR